MAVSNLQLNVSANTARALADFRRFSRTLDNQFLVSGLKLDVIRSSLNQINRDFQRAIGEQGLASATSLRAAQNQAAILTQVFKGFAAESSLAISRDLGTALNSVAVRAGGTMKDVQRTLAATPFISPRIGDQMREQLTTGIMAFQRDMRRSGLGDNFSEMMTQFLSGGATGMDLIRQGGPIGTLLGSEIIRRVGGEGLVYDPKQRSEIAAQIVGNKDLQDQLRRLSVSTSGYLIILEDLNTNLFNTEKGVFGSLRKVIDRTGQSTTMFDEVYKLVDTVFGKEGTFAKFFKNVNEVFGIKDPMRPLIDMVQFLTGVFRNISAVFESSGFKKVVGWAKSIFDQVAKVFKSVYDSVANISSSGFTEDSIVKGIREIGESIRKFIRDIGKRIRGTDTEKETGAIANIAGTLLEEMGKTAVVVIKELFMTLVDKVPEIAAAVLPAINRGINAILTELFGVAGGRVAKFALGFVPGPIGAIARASAAGDVTGDGESPLSMLAMGGAALFGPRLLSRVISPYGRAATARGINSWARRNQNRLNRYLFLRSPQGNNRFTGLTGLANPLTSLILNGLPLPGISGLGSVGSSVGRFIGNIPQVGQALFSNSLSAMAGAGQGLSSRLGALGVFLNSQKSQFMAGFRPPFPNVGIGSATTRAYQVGQFARNLPGNFQSFLNSSLNNISTGLSSFGSSLVTSARSTASSISSASRSVMTSLINLGTSTYQASLSAVRSFTRSSMVSQFRAGMNPAFPNVAVGGPTTTAFRAGGALRRFGGYALLGGLAVAGSQALGGAIGGRAGGEVSSIGTILGSGLSGAATGAMIGSIIPGIGTAAGAIIGGIIGGIAPLMDRGVREGAQSFLSRIRGFFSWLGESIQGTFKWMGDSIAKALKFGINVFIGVINGALSGMLVIPRMVVGIVSSLYNQLPDAIKPGWATQAIGAMNTVTSLQIPTINYEGSGFYGPALGLEARMSGRRPMVVNDGEFVIPNNGFSTLAGLVGDNLRRTGVLQDQSNPGVNLNVTLELNVNSVVADPQQLADALRDPVLQIISDAWREANITTVRRPRIS